MLFSPDICSIQQTPKQKIKLVAKYSDGSRKIIEVSSKIPILHVTESVKSHKITFDGKEILIHRKKFIAKITEFTHCSFKLASIIKKALLNIESETVLCNFVNHTLCFNQWKNRIIPIQQNREPQNTESYYCAVNLNRFITRYLDQFSTLHPDLKTFFEDYQSNEIQPLIFRIERILHSTIRSLTISAAAAKGKAFTNAINAIVNLEQQQFLATPTDRPNQIILLSNLECVFKKGNSVSREEESIVESLFTLSMKNGVVDGMQFNLLASHRFGNSLLTREEYDRSFAICSLSPLVREAICRRLKDEYHHNLWLKISPCYDKRDNLTRVYLHYLNLNYMVYYNNKMHCLNFNTFKMYLNEGKFTADTPIRTAESLLLQPLDLFLDNENLREALNYQNILDMKGRTLFVPHFHSQEFKSIYEKIEKKTWEYLVDDDWITVTFKELQCLWLIGHINISTKVCEKGAIDSVRIADSDILECLDVLWTIHFPEIKIEYEDHLENFTRSTARTYVHQMILFSEMDHEKPSFVQILNRLDDDSILKTLLTAEFQFLDLHLNNLGVTANLSEKHKYFTSLEYETDLGQGPLKDLFMDYLDGDLTANHRIAARTSPERPFIQLPETIIKDLFSVLESTWRLELFDTEYAMGESNIIQGYCMDYKKPNQRNGHLIPFRSDLLATHWRDLPLKMSIVKSWLDPHRLLRIRSWVNRRDAPIKRLLPLHIIRGLENKIDEFLNSPEFSISKHSSEDKEMTIEQLSDLFAAHISNLDCHETLWIFLEKTLLNVSKGYFRDLLTNHGKRFRIAKQLFPRLTYFQRQALFDRQNQVTRYLNLYEQMFEPNDDLQKLLLLEEIFNDSCSPFSTIESEKYLMKLEELKYCDQEDHLTNLFEYIKDKMTPTYFNIVKSMYPLLADTCLLADHFHPNRIESGRKIGEYLTPMDVLIEKGKADSNEDIRQTALHIEKEIVEADKQFKAYFGNFVTKYRKE